MILTDYPMKCCGMVEASNIYVPDWDSKGKPLSEEEYTVQWDELFGKIEEHQLRHRRNCAMISLAGQRRAEEQALKRGWKEVFQFYNPNSGNIVKLFTKVLWESVYEYKEAVEGGTYVNPESRSLWTQRQPEAVHAL